MKNLTSLIFIFHFCICFSQNTTTLSQALNITSKQSMLCERLAKEKVFKVTNPNYFNPEQKLGVSLIQFERNIARLKEMNLPKDTSFLITTLEMLWFTYKKNILDKDHISTIKTMEYNKIMFSFCEKTFNNLLSYAKKKESYPYNTSINNFSEAYIASNKLKDLSQKLSLYYNVYYSKVNDYDAAYFQSIFSDIDASINSIKKLKDLNPMIKEKTSEIEKEWTDLKLKMKEAVKTNFEAKENYLKPLDILKQNNKLLKDADLLTRYYKEQSETN